MVNTLLIAYPLMSESAVKERRMPIASLKNRVYASLYLDSKNSSYLPFLINSRL